MSKNIFAILLSIVLLCGLLSETICQGKELSKNNRSNCGLSSGFHEFSFQKTSIPVRENIFAGINLGGVVGSGFSMPGSESGLSLHNDFAFEIYAMGSLSDEVHLIAGYHCWKTKDITKSKAGLTLWETDFTSKNAIIAFDFQLFKIAGFTFALEQSFFIGSSSSAVSTTFGFGEGFCLRSPVLYNMTNVVVKTRYSKSGEMLNFGGGTGFSLFSYLIGLETTF